MNKKLLVLAVSVAVAAPTLALADGVELYGILDEAIVSASATKSLDGTFPSAVLIKGGTAAATTTSVTGLVSGGIQGSRWGLKGSEDLGNGLKAVFQLESGFQANNGALSDGYIAKGANGDSSSQNGQLFGRTAWVGLSDAELGTIKFGRNYSVFYDIFNDYDPVQFATLFSAAGNSGTLGGGAGVTENSRQDNSVKYTGKTGNASYTAMYKFGNIAGSSSSGSAYGLQGGYQAGNLGLSAGYMSTTDSVNLSNTTTGMLVNTSAYLVAAKYKFNDALTGKASYERVQFLNASNPGLVNSFLSYYGGHTLTSVVARTVGSAGFNMTSIGGDYKLSDKLGLYAGYYSVNYEANGGSKSTATNNAAFTETYTSAMVDYSLSKRTDVYAGGIVITTSQAGSSGFNVLAAGIRHKF